jgi:hypothetical protein
MKANSDIQSFRGSSARFDPPGEDVSDPERRMPEPSEQSCFCQPQDGYRGIWHGQPDFFPIYGPKYGGGLGTYPYQSRPMAVYAPEAEKTFFCWGGTTAGSDPRTRCWDFGAGNLLQMVSYYDHRTGRVPRPVCVFDKWCADPHDNPVIEIDGAGHLWLFSPSHGDWTTRSFIHRSVRPYDISEWATMPGVGLFAYPQPHYEKVRGWFFLHTLYSEGRGLQFTTSPDGLKWSEVRHLSRFGQGHYQVSAVDPLTGRIGVAFDYYPPVGGLEARTNLYYLQSDDWGRSWQTASGESVQIPLKDANNPALVYPFESEQRLVYLRDIQFDRSGCPVIALVTSGSHIPGPESGPHRWEFFNLQSGSWAHLPGMACDNNYDHGEFMIDPGNGEWRLVAPTETGPQPFNPGGEIALWSSSDAGLHWQRERQLTRGSTMNHTFCRRSRKHHPDFFAFWADGNAREPSSSRLYFCDQSGKHVFRLPATMGQTETAPEAITAPA